MSAHAGYNVTEHNGFFLLSVHGLIAIDSSSFMMVAHSIMLIICSLDTRSFAVIVCIKYLEICLFQLQGVLKNKGDNLAAKLFARSIIGELDWLTNVSSSLSFYFFGKDFMARNVQLIT